MRQNKCVDDITSQANIGGVKRDMVLMEKALNLARIGIVGETRRILLREPASARNLSDLSKGLLAIEDFKLYSMEENIGKSTTKIDLGIDLYDMENWD